MPRKVPCSVCGDLRPLGGKTKNATTVTCRKCQNNRHNPYTQYKKGCRCEKCKTFVVGKVTEYSQRYREEHGRLPSSAWRAKHPGVRRGSEWISREERLAIYNRDNWLCTLCANPIDRAADSNDDLAPSLDHIRPRRRGGTDDAANLRLAHRICNSRRGVNEDY